MNTFEIDLQGVVLKLYLFISFQCKSACCASSSSIRIPTGDENNGNEGLASAGWECITCLLKN